ncbi:unnamed protein product [Coregonus sp. 'balchen']|nr:unnamed protein product [Coregonus sp. 'balchen']
MTDPTTSPEDHWIKNDGAFSDNGFDHSFFAENARKSTVVSRANSIGSTSASSVPNTDDEDSDYRHETTYKESYKDRRRQAHTQAEQKRRDAIKKGYDDLQSIVPTCQQQSDHRLHPVSAQGEEEAGGGNVYVEEGSDGTEDHENGEEQVSDQVKFSVFQSIMDSLFQSFSSSVSVASFQELSACVFSWIEEHCKPQTLREFVVGVLRQLNSQLY